MPWPPAELLLPTFLGEGESLSIPYFAMLAAKHLPVKCKRLKTQSRFAPPAQVQGLLRYEVQRAGGGERSGINGPGAGDTGEEGDLPSNL